jgi:hypothetical protein
MNRTIKSAALVAVLAAGGLGLAGCSGLSGILGGAAAGAGTAAGGNATVQQACVAAQPVLTAGAMSTNSTATNIASYGNAFCGPVLAGTMPATTDSNSASWVLGLVQTLSPLLLAAL